MMSRLAVCCCLSHSRRPALWLAKREMQEPFCTEKRKLIIMMIILFGFLSCVPCLAVWPAMQADKYMSAMFSHLFSFFFSENSALPHGRRTTPCRSHLFANDIPLPRTQLVIGKAKSNTTSLVIVIVVVGHGA